VLVLLIEWCSSVSNTNNEPYRAGGHEAVNGLMSSLVLVGKSVIIFVAANREKIKNRTSPIRLNVA
jgi:hypothetical protein